MVPLQLLIGMFSDGVNSLKELANQKKARASDLTGNTGARRVRNTPKNKLYDSSMFLSFCSLQCSCHVSNKPGTVITLFQMPV